MSEHKINPFSKGTAVDLPPVVRDVYGRLLAEGDQVFLQLGSRLLFAITTIAPCVDPALPSNLMDITVVCRMKFRAVRNDPNNEFVRIITAEETKPKPEGVAS